MSSILVACGNKSGADAHYIPALRSGGWTGTVRLVAPGDVLPDVQGISGLLLCGGRDIHPKLWDDSEATHPLADVDEVRDAFEVPLVRRAWELGLPILGICRGEQLLNAMLGGSLIQDIAEYFHCDSECHRHGSSETPDLHHGVRIAAVSRLGPLLGSFELRVNSRHHQAVKRLAPGLRAVAWDLDTVHPETGPLIEGIEAEDPKRWAFGVQWHPENLVDLQDGNGEAARRIFEGFVLAAGQRV